MAVNVLFLHQNFPGQYQHLAPELGGRDGFKVIALGQKQPFGVDFGPVRYVGYSSGAHPDPDLFPPLAFFSEQVRRADVARWRLHELKQKGFSPDICFAHPGWGEALFLRDVFPKTKLVSYLEYYYRSEDSDLDFDPEFRLPSTDQHYVSLRNLPTLQAAAISDVVMSPTRWQAQTFPVSLSDRIAIIHEGIDTTIAKPGPARPLPLPSGGMIHPGQTLITYVSRSLEPYRGFHTFMRSLPHLLKMMPHAHVAIVGKEQPSYGRNPQQGGTWKQVMFDELGEHIDRERVHFLGTLSYSDLLNLFRLSTVHVYLTYPFVLSWSLLDAMACGCVIVGSATGPVTEVIQDGENGVLVDFFDAPELAHQIALLADDTERRDRLSRHARSTVVNQYDYRTVCLPAYDQLITATLST